MMNDDVMICPKERGYGVDKGIPTLVIAAASVDDVLAISGFTILLGITFKPDADLVSIIFQGPLEAVVGLLFGTAYGALVAFLPARNTFISQSSAHFQFTLRVRLTSGQVGKQSERQVSCDF